MPIDDALKRIDREPEDEESRKEGIPPGFDEIMRPYLKALHNRYISFDDEKMSAFAKCMRFNENFETVLKPIPQKELAELISRQDPEFKELAEVSNAAEYIDNPCDITCRKNYEKLNFVTKMNEIIDFEQIKIFGVLGRTVIIPNLDYLSMFIKEEEKLRRYAKEIKEEYQTGAILTITNLKITVDPELSFNTSTLIDFCRLTGINDIKNMIDEVYDLFQGIQKINNAPKLRQYLFKRIKKYYPELCYTPKNKEVGPEENSTPDEIEDDSGENLPDAYDLLEDDIPVWDKRDQKERDKEMRELNELEMLDREEYANKHQAENDAEQKKYKNPGDISDGPDMLGPDDDIPF